MIRKSVFCIAALYAMCSSLYAQDSADNYLNEVIVTANRYEQKQNATGKVVTVINKEMIAKSTGKTVAQLLNEQAGVVVNGALSNMGSVQTVYMRGASSGRALILLDGVPVNDPSTINNEFDLNLFSLNDVERIEICRGAQSTLYGSDAIAGVINIITIKKDVTKAFNGAAAVSAGNYGMLKGAAQLYGKTGRLNYAVRYAKLYANGFSAATDTVPTPHTTFDKDSYNGDNVNAQVSYQATPALTLKTFALYSKYKTNLDASAFTDDQDFTVRNNSLLAGAGFNYKNDVVNVSGNYRYNELHRHNLNDSTDGSFYFKDDYFGKSQFAELYAAVKLANGFTLLQGGDYRINNMSNVNTYGSFKDTSVSQASLYASLNYTDAKNRLNAELGGRLNVHSRYGSNYTYTFNPSYAFSNHFRLYGSISTGFKVPSLYQLYSAYGDPNLQPEKSINYEAGFQYSSSVFNTRVTYFNRKITNGLDYNYTTNVYFNFDKEKDQGIEWEEKIQITKALFVSANYTWLDAREQTKNRVPYQIDFINYIYYFHDTTYNYALRRPKHSLNVTVSYQYKNLFVSAGGKYVSRRYDASYASTDVRLDAYFLLSAYAEYKLEKNVKLFADAKNIFNKQFYDVYGYNSIPFLLNAGVTVNF